MLAVTHLQAVTGPKVTPGRQGNATWILRESPSFNGKWWWPAVKDHFQWWGDLPLKWKGQQEQCEDMGEWKSACHSGGYTWLSKSQCVLCRIKADCVRPVHLWGTNRYWPKVPGNANQLLDSTTSCWETWLTLSARWGDAALASRCPHVSQRALAKQMDWPRWTKWPGVLQVAPEITGPDRLWLFSWGYVKDRVYVPPLPATVDELQERVTAAVNSVTPDMLQRVWSELDYRIDVCQVTRGGHIECVWYHMKLWVYATVATNFIRII